MGRLYRNKRRKQDDDDDDDLSVALDEKSLKRKKGAKKRSKYFERCSEARFYQNSKIPPSSKHTLVGKMKQIVRYSLYAKKMHISPKTSFADEAKQLIHSAHDGHFERLYVGAKRNCDDEGGTEVSAKHLKSVQKTLKNFQGPFFVINSFPSSKQGITTSTSVSTRQ